MVKHQAVVSFVSSITLVRAAFANFWRSSFLQSCYFFIVAMLAHAWKGFHPSPLVTPDAADAMGRGKLVYFFFFRCARLRRRDTGVRGLVSLSDWSRGS